MIIANTHRMDKVPQNMAGFFAGIGQFFYQNIVLSIPQGTAQILMIAAIFGLIIGVTYYLMTQKNERQIKSDQTTIFGMTYDSLAQKRKGVNDYLAEKIVQESKNNWVLFNFAPLTVFDAGYMGPGYDGLYDTQAIRRALDLGFRCFVFSIDYYTGQPKNQNDFVGPGEPCLLHRDDQGVIRSRNCGRIDDMMNALAQQAFSPSMATGNDPLIVILDFKNVPDKTKNEAEYITFLKSVSEKIQPLRTTFLDRLGDSPFSGLQNPALLFTQNFQSLRGKTMIFTNVNTDVLSKSTTNIPMYQNLRHWINAQIFSLSSDALPRDSVTEVQPKGVIMTIGRQSAPYFLETPPDKIKEAQLKTNNVFTLMNIPEANANQKQETIETLTNKFGVQMISYNLFVTPQETEKFLDWWGPYSWKLKPTELQYIVVRAEPPKPISVRADANGGNVAPPALHF
jgi:hypothetical protein